MSNQHDCECEFVGSRWRKYGKEPPRSGEVFVGRLGNAVYPHLFLVLDRDRIVYFNDHSTMIGSPYDIFTDWLPVAEARVK